MADWAGETRDFAVSRWLFATFLSRKRNRRRVSGHASWPTRDNDSDPARCSSGSAKMLAALRNETRLSSQVRWTLSDSRRDAG